MCKSLRSSGRTTIKLSKFNLFQTYPISESNPGFSIQIPSDWQIDEEIASGIVNFAGMNNSPLFIVDIKEASNYLDTNTLTLKSNSLQQSIQEKLNYYSHISQVVNMDYKILRQNPVKVGGNIGIKVEFRLGPQYNYDVFFNGNEKIYRLGYADSPGNVPQTVQLANKVAESFQIIKEYFIKRYLPESQLTNRILKTDYFEWNCQTPRNL